MLKLLLFALLTLIPAAAQEDEWRAVLFDNASGTLFVINTEAVLRTVVVEEFTADFDFSGALTVSPDDATLAFVSGTFDGTGSTLYLADLTAETCCTAVPDPLPETTTRIGDGIFSPEGTQFAAAFINREEGTGIIGVVDLTGDAPEVIASLDLADTDWEPGGDIIFSTWTADGISFAPLCAGCAPVNLSVSTWDPQRGDLTVSDEVSFRLSTDITSGEVVARVLTEELGPPPVPEGNMRIVGNGVRYQSTPTDGTYTIIFHDPEIAVQNVAWGMNGAAVLVQHFESAGATVVLRDGTQIEIDLPEDDHLLIGGTPTGWLLVEGYYQQGIQETYPLLHVTLDGEEAVYTEIGEVPFNTYILSAPPLMPEDTSPFPPDPDA